MLLYVVICMTRARKMSLAARKESSLAASYLGHTEINSGFTSLLQQNSVVVCSLDVLAFVFKYRMWLYPQHLLGQRHAAKLCAVCQAVPRMAGEARLPSLALLCFFVHCIACRPKSAVLISTCPLSHSVVKPDLSYR